MHGLVSWKPHEATKVALPQVGVLFAAPLGSTFFGGPHDMLGENWFTVFSKVSADGWVCARSLDSVSDAFHKAQQMSRSTTLGTWYLDSARVAKGLRPLKPLLWTIAEVERENA